MLYVTKGAMAIRDKRALDLAKGVSLWVAFLVVPDDEGGGLKTREHRAWAKWRKGQPLGMVELAREHGTSMFHAARRFHDTEARD